MMQSFENYIIFNVMVWPHLTVYRTYLYIYIGIEIGKQCSFDRLITFSYLIRSSRMGQRFQLKAMGRMTRYFYVSTLDFDFYWHWHWLHEQRAANAVRHIDALLLIIFGEMAELYCSTFTAWSSECCGSQRQGAAGPSGRLHVQFN